VFIMKRQPGSVSTEYALLLVFLTLACLWSLVFTGHSTANLLEQNTNNLNGRSVQDLVSLNFGKASKTTNNPSAPAILNPTAGTLVGVTGTMAASLPLASGSSGGTNATSTEGGRKLLIYASLSQAEAVLQIAAASTDPATSDWANKVAQSLYFMGGTEGSFTGISELGIPSQTLSTYTQNSALTDLATYNTTLQQLLANPPTSGSPAELAQVNALSQESSTIANQFIQAGGGLISATGGLEKSLLLGMQIGFSGGGSLGIGYMQTYDQLVSYDTLKANAATVLQNANYQQQATPTYSTLQNAQTVDTQANGTTSTP
jgi:uncharacterized protein (UPF0333 family)